MKYWFTALCGGLMMTSYLAQAGVVVGATRLVYDGSKNESTLTVTNPDDTPYLIQSRVESTPRIQLRAGGQVGQIQPNNEEKAPFILTPPLFRLEGVNNTQNATQANNNINTLRVVRVGGALPEDRESLYWLNIKSIPSAKRRDNTLQLAIATRIKLLYRPAALKGQEPDAVSNQLSWKRSGSRLTVNNPTPFYMNFSRVTVGKQDVSEATYVAPFSQATFPLPATATGNAVSWQVINDYGGSGTLRQGNATS